MLPDRTVHLSTTNLIAWLLWAAAGVCMIAMFALLDADPLKGLVFGTLGCVVASGAAVAQVRGFMCVFSSRMKEAFLLGREVERQHQQERELRSV